MTDTTLTAHVVKLAALRAEESARMERIRMARLGFEATIEDEKRNLEAVKRAVEAAEAEVRGLALIVYDQSDKSTLKVAPGVELKRGVDVSIADRDAAFAWAKASQVGYVPEGFDEKMVLGMFSGVKPKMQPLPFIKVSAPYHKVQLATDLTKALAAEMERAA